MNDQLSEDASRLLACLSSPLHLRVLLLLHADPSRWWDAPGIGRRLDIPVDAADAGLDRLSADNMLDIRVAGAVCYRFAPWRPSAAAAVDELANWYRRRRGRLWMLRGWADAP